MPNTEQWLPVVGYEEFYAVSSRGRVKRLSPNCGTAIGHIRVPCLNSVGYPQLILSVNRKRICVTVHSLVAKAFIPNPDNLPQVNHKNGIKHDNRVENLEWVSVRGNRLHAIEHNLINTAKGTRCWNAKLTDKAVAEIRARWIPYKVSQASLAAEYGVSPAVIQLIVTRKKWKHVP